jgi:hypothetical protein
MQSRTLVAPGRASQLPFQHAALDFHMVLALLTRLTATIQQSDNRVRGVVVTHGPDSGSPASPLQKLMNSAASSWIIPLTPACPVAIETVP